MGIVIDTPGQFYTLLTESLRKTLSDNLGLIEYDEAWKQEITRPTVVVQFEDAHPGTRQATGRYCHRQMVTVHSLIPKSTAKAVLQATDLSMEIERFLDLNRFGIDPKCCGAPEIQVNGDTSYLFGFDGIVARGVQWIQPLYLGRDYFEPELPRGGIGLAVNPVDPDDPDAYQPLTPGGKHV